MLFKNNKKEEVFMFQRLEDVEKRYEELNGLISDPEVISRQNEWKKLMKEHSDIENIKKLKRQWKKQKKCLMILK